MHYQLALWLLFNNVVIDTQAHIYFHLNIAMGTNSE